MRTIILFIAAFVCMNANAQEYKSMLPDGRVWKIVSPGDGTYAKDLCYTETICGDTIVAGRTCKRVHIYCTTPEEARGLQTDYYIALFEEGGKLYQAHSDGNGKKLDFSIHEGDRISNNNSTVMCEDYIEVRGQVYRRLTLDTNFGDSEDDDPRSYWVEGIGSSRDYWYYSDIRPTWIHNYFIMTECYDNGKLVFTQEDFHKEALPSGITQVSGAEKTDGRMYNLLGQRINAPKKGDIYIMNGKKRMAR